MPFLATPLTPEPLRHSLRLLQRNSPSPERPIMRNYSSSVTEHTASCTTATCYHLFHAMIMEENSDWNAAQVEVRSQYQQLSERNEQFLERMRELGSMINQPRRRRISTADFTRRMHALENEMRKLFRQKDRIMKEWHNLAKIQG